MKTYFKNIILSASVLATAVTLARGANVYSVNVVSGPQWYHVDGKWNAEFESTVGHLKYVYDLKGGPLTQDGVAVTGKALRIADTQTNETELIEGKLVGNDISFVEPLSAGGQDLRIEYKGTVAGDEMKLTRTVGDLASTNLVAIRMKPGDVTGKWDAEFDTQIGHAKYTYVLTQDSDKLTGTAIRVSDTDTNTTVLTNGMVSGDEVSFMEPLKVAGQDQEVDITYKGKLAGDEIKFTRTVGEFATNEISAKREK